MSASGGVELQSAGEVVQGFVQHALDGQNIIAKVRDDRLRPFVESQVQGEELVSVRDGLRNSRRSKA
jgi:hypothetical protein